MKHMLKKGLEVIGLHNRTFDLPHETLATIDRCKPFTMTSFERLAALCGAVEYAVANNIPGSFVECGVWKGGSSMVAALTYLEQDRSDVDLYLFDTYEGMSDPTEHDTEARSGKSAAKLLKNASKNQGIWAYAQLDEVQANLHSTGYPAERMHFIKGKVEDTIPQSAPQSISILRLDTDWYQSTKHELVHLYPRLSRGGVLIIDDYGHWAGARRAVDEYIEEQKLQILLHRIDYTGRMCVKM